MSPVHIEPTAAQRSTEFARLFEQDLSAPQLKEGSVVRGRVVRIDRDHVVVDIGFKSEGQIPLEEFKNPRGQLNANVGDEVEVMLEVLEDDQGALILSKERADAMRTWDRLAEVFEKDGEIEGTVVAKVKGGLSVDIGVRAFLPGSQIDLRPARNLDKYVGETYTFKIIKLNKRRGNVVLSRKVILEKERESMKVQTLAHLSEGQVFDGIVKNVTDYGVFVDLGGVDGLLHITDMTWGRINHPSEMFSVGDSIRVVVLKFDGATQKVSLGLKQLMPDPWGGVENTFPVGSRVHGKVVSLTDYGAFVALQDGVEGLIHISEMTWSKKIKHPSKVLNVGQEVDAIVLDVDTQSKRISLGMKQLLPNPWHQLEENYPVGTKVRGQVRNIADFGVFVDVGADVDGLIHISDMCWVQNFSNPTEVFKKGDEVEAVVLTIDPDNERFSLGLKHLQNDPWDIINKQYKEGAQVEGTVTALNNAGAVVKIADGVEGLVEKVDLPETVQVGDQLVLLIKRMEPRDRQFLLKPVAA